PGLPRAGSTDFAILLEEAASVLVRVSFAGASGRCSAVAGTVFEHATNAIEQNTSNIPQLIFLFPFTVILVLHIVVVRCFCSVLARSFVRCFARQIIEKPARQNRSSGGRSSPFGDTNHKLQANIVRLLMA